MTSQVKDIKRLEYQGKCNLGKERININVALDSSLIANLDNNSTDSSLSIEERIEKLEQNITMLQNTDVYKDLRKKHVARVIPPIKKTNVILKNTNFQYAMKLWDFLQSHVANDTKITKEHKNYEENGIIKDYLNNTFYLTYLAIDTLSKDKTTEEYKKNIEEITDNLIERIVELNVDMPLSTLKEKIGDKIAITKLKKQASLSEIQNVFLKSIDNYLEKIENFKF